MQILRRFFKLSQNTFSYKFSPLWSAVLWDNKEYVDFHGLCWGLVAGYDAFVWIREMCPYAAEPWVGACEQIGHHEWVGYLVMCHVIVMISNKPSILNIANSINLLLDCKFSERAYCFLPLPSLPFYLSVYVTQDWWNRSIAYILPVSSCAFSINEFKLSLY